MSILLAGFFLLFALRRLDWAAFFSILKSANYFYIGLLFFWNTISYLLRAFRWRILLSSYKPISLSTVFWGNMTGYLGNNLLPARAGELIRAVFISKGEKIPLSFVFATGFVERFVDLVVLVLLGLTLLPYLPNVPVSLQNILQSMTIISLFGVLSIFVLPYFTSTFEKFFNRLGFLPVNLKDKLLAFLNDFLEGIKALHYAHQAVFFLVFTFSIWLVDGVGIIILGKAIGYPISIIESFLFLASLGIASALPSTPGYIGIYQFVAVLILIPFGFTQESAIAFSLLMQLIGFLSIFFWGSIGVLVGSRFNE